MQDLANVLESRVQDVREKHYKSLPRAERASRDKRITSADQWNIVKTSLERLHVMDVFNPDSLEVSLLSVQVIVMFNVLGGE